MIIHFKYIHFTIGDLISKPICTECMYRWAVHGWERFIKISGTSSGTVTKYLGTSSMFFLSQKADSSTKENILGCALMHLTKAFFFFPHSAFNRFPNSFGQERPVTRNFVQDSYTHVKTQIGVLCRTWTRKMKCLIWFKVGTDQQCNRVVEILQISLDSVLGFFSYSREIMQLVKPKIDTVGWFMPQTCQTRAVSLTWLDKATFNTHAP